MAVRSPRPRPERASADRRFEAAVATGATAAVGGRDRIDDLVADLNGVGFRVALIERPAALSTTLERFRRRGICAGDVIVVGRDLGGTEAPLEAVLDDQLRRRRRGELPCPSRDPEWTLKIEGFDRTLERAHETLLTLADGRIGTRGAPLVGDTVTNPRVFAAGVYDDEGAQSHLLSCPVWNRLDAEGTPP
jgi:hypothetical protein